MTQRSVLAGMDLDRRPVVVAIAGSNGAGKTTFYYTHFQASGLPFVNADVLARELRIDPYAAARVADGIRKTLVDQGESFVFETVFSDPAGEKIAFLKDAERRGYNVILCFIGITGPAVSEERVLMRVLQGGHDVPYRKLEERFPRTVANLKTAFRVLSVVWVFENDDLKAPYRLVAVTQGGRVVKMNRPVPKWLLPLLPSDSH